MKDEQGVTKTIVICLQFVIIAILSATVWFEHEQKQMMIESSREEDLLFRNEVLRHENRSLKELISRPNSNLIDVTPREEK